MMGKFPFKCLGQDVRMVLCTFCVSSGATSTDKKHKPSLIALAGVPSVTTFPKKSNLPRRI